MLKRHFTEELVFYGIVSSINPLRTELHPKIILKSRIREFFHFYLERYYTFHLACAISRK